MRLGSAAKLHSQVESYQDGNGKRVATFRGGKTNSSSNKRSTAASAVATSAAAVATAINRKKSSEGLSSLQMLMMKQDLVRLQKKQKVITGLKVAHQ